MNRSIAVLSLTLATSGAALLGCGLLDTPADPRFDDLTRLAATLTGAPALTVADFDIIA